MRYIEMNLVRAGMVSHPSEYRWSSFVANARGKANSLLKPHGLYLALSKDQAGRQHVYRELFRHDIDARLVYEIREMLNQELVLGREDFKDVIELMAQRQVRRGGDGRPPKN